MKKKIVFLHFFIAAPKKFNTFDALPIAHFDPYVPNFLKHLWKLAISLKLWVPAHFEVG